MTSVTTHHDVFSAAKASSSSSIFPNDFSSKNALDKLAQAKAIEAANKKKADAEAAEIAKKLDAYPKLEAQIQTLRRELESTKSQKVSGGDDQGRMGELEKQLAQFRQDMDLMRIRLSQPSRRCNLDHSYHDKPVQIKLACWPHTALDFAGPHGWEYSPAFEWQWLRLRRVNLEDNESPWTISNHAGDLYLGLSEGCPSKVEAQRSRRTEGDAKARQEWCIGLNWPKTGYIIENRLLGWLQMDEPRENKSGKRLTNANKYETEAGQVWHIVLR